MDSRTDYKIGLLDDNIERFWNKVNKHNSISECWTWTGQLDSKRGNPVFKVFKNGKEYHYQSVRVSYYLVNGCIPNHKTIGKTCGNQLCVNPEHMVVGKRGAPRIPKSDILLDGERKGWTWDGRRDPKTGEPYCSLYHNLPVYVERYGKGKWVPIEEADDYITDENWIRKLPKMTDVSPCPKPVIHDTIWKKLVRFIGWLLSF